METFISWRCSRYVCTPKPNQHHHHHHRDQMSTFNFNWCLLLSNRRHRIDLNWSVNIIVSCPCTCTFPIFVLFIFFSIYICRIVSLSLNTSVEASTNHPKRLYNGNLVQVHRGGKQNPIEWSRRDGIHLRNILNKSCVGTYKFFTIEKCGSWIQLLLAMLSIKIERMAMNRRSCCNPPIGRTQTKMLPIVSL